MKADDFMCGDVVRLKSGGPRMTVDAANDFGIVNVLWFDLKGRLRDAAFEREQLEHAPKESLLEPMPLTVTLEKHQ